MSKYNEGDKFVIEIEEKYNSQTTPFSEELYKIKGFNSLVFDDNGLNKIQKINPQLEIEDIDDMLAEYDLKKESYEKGLNDAWELTRKLFGYVEDGNYTTTDLCRIFGTNAHADIVSLDYQEVLAKMEDYKKKQEEIKIGDIVFCFADQDDNWRENEENYGVVTGIYDTNYQVLMKNGDCCGFEKNVIEKTGKHIDIESVFKQIGGGE